MKHFIKKSLTTLVVASAVVLSGCSTGPLQTNPDGIVNDYIPEGATLQEAYVPNRSKLKDTAIVLGACAVTSVLSFALLGNTAVCVSPIPFDIAWKALSEDVTCSHIGDVQYDAEMRIAYLYLVNHNKGGPYYPDPPPLGNWSEYKHQPRLLVSPIDSHGGLSIAEGCGVKFKTL